MRQWWLVALIVVIAFACLWFLLHRYHGNKEPRRLPGAVQEDAEAAEEKSAEDYEPVSGPRAARRLLCLMSLNMRASMEMTLNPLAKNPDPEEVKACLGVLARLNSWLQEESLWEAFSAREKVLMQKDPGKWTPQERIDASWRCEASGVLAWSLCLPVKVPPYDTQFEIDDLIKQVPLMAAASDFVAGARLRPVNELREAREIAEQWLWRARTTTLQKKGCDKLPKGMTFPQIIAMSAEYARDHGRFTPIDNDFPAFGKSYAQLSDAEWSMMQSMASERLYGLNWVCGYEQDWDKVPTGT